MKYIFVIVLMSLLTAFLAGCDKSTEPSKQGSLSFSSRYSSSVPPQAIISAIYKSGAVAAVDSIRISRSRFVLRDIKFKSATDSMNFQTAPMVLDLNLSSAVQTIRVTEVPFKTYERIEFEVHRVESTDVNVLPPAERAVFSDFLAGDRYSIIIEGTVYRTPESDISFVFRSRISAKQKVDLIPLLVINESNPVVNTTLLISSGNWFSGGGGLLDPTDSRNENSISDNLKNSIRVFKDNNKDGSKDPN